MSFLNVEGDSLTIERLTKAPGIYSVTRLKNKNFKTYLELQFKQRTDHESKEDTSTFLQRIVVGFNHTEAPVTLVTEGYQINYAYKYDWNSDPAIIFNTGVVVVEQRYTGQSKPGDTLFIYLNTKQIASDYHYIFNTLRSLLVGKWITTGISKGGQSSLAYMKYYPEDMKGCIIYGTPVRNEENDGRINSFIGAWLSSPCGRMIRSIQHDLFRNKQDLIKAIPDHGQFSLPLTELADHLILELPFSFLQLCHSCETLPPEDSTPEQLYTFLLKIVPVRFYKDKSVNSLQHAYVLASRELGYYEYNKRAFTRFLSRQDICIQDLGLFNQEFNSAHILGVGELLKRNPERFIFLYGSLDPYSSLKPEIQSVFLAPGTCHKVFIGDMQIKERKEIRKRVEGWF